MSRSVDVWDDEPRRPTSSNASGLGSASGNRLKASTPVVVQDDWEADDDEEEEDVGRSLEDKNKQIWEDANTKEHHPMPALVISRGVSASITTPTLPLNQPPPMRILKRPSASPSPASTSASTPTGETLQEREARYQAARERIFGSGEAGVVGASETAENKKNPASKKSGSQEASPTPTSPPSAAAATSKVVRNPRGPTNTSSGNVVSGNSGFAERKKAAPPTTAAAAISSTTTTSATTS